MRRTTISLPDELADAVQREARRRSVSVSEFAREALGATLRLTAERRRLGFVALGRSGSRDTARRVDEILSREWTTDRGR